MPINIGPSGIEPGLSPPTGKYLANMFTNFKTYNNNNWTGLKWWLKPSRSTFIGYATASHLFSLTEVSHMSFIISPSHVEPSPGPLTAKSGYQTCLGCPGPTVDGANLNTPAHGNYQPV